MVLETALRIAARALLFNHRLGAIQYSRVFGEMPDVGNRLLNIASLPRAADNPHCESSFLAMFVMRLLLAAPAPHGYPAWGNTKIRSASPESGQLQMNAFYRNLSLFFCRPEILPKLSMIYTRPLKESPSNNLGLFG